MATKKQLAKAREKTKFSKTNQPKNKGGRKKSELKDFMSISRVSLDDFKRLIDHVAMQTSKSDLKAIKNDPTNPPIVCLFASVFEQAIKKGRMYDVNLIIDRLYGKAAEKIEAKVVAAVTDIDVTLTPEQQQEYDKRIKEFLEPAIDLSSIRKENEGK